MRSPFNILCFCLCAIQSAHTQGLFHARKLEFTVEPVRNGQQGPGYTYPVGARVVMLCTVKVTGLNGSDLVLQHDDVQIPVELHSTNTVRSVIEVGHGPDSGVYRCCIRECVHEFPFTSEPLLTITFGHPPPEPSNFHCISSNWRNLQCSWDVNGMNDTSNFWISRFIYNGYENGSCEKTGASSTPFPCSCNNKTTGINQTGTLACNPSRDHFLKNRSYQFQVWGYNQYGDSFWNYTIFTDTSIVKLSPVKSLHLKERSSKGIQVVWDPNLMSSFMTRLQCQVEIVKLESNHKLLNPIVMTVSTNLASSNNLSPHSEYSVRVKCRPRGGHYWSDASSIVVTTMEDVPAASPVSTTGAFSRVSSGGNLDCVIIYWKPIELQSRNGVITSYSISSSSLNQLQLPSVQNPNSDTFSSEINSIYGEEDHVITLKGRNSKAWSPKYLLSVPNKNKAPMKPKWVVVEYLNSSCETYQITWKLQSEDLAAEDEVTIFWCLAIRKGKFVDCQAGLDWVVRPSNITMYTVSPQHARTSNSLLRWFFGVAITRNNLSNGITWNECIFKYDGGASKPQVLSVSAIGATDVQVSWHFSFCDTTQVQGKPEQYLVAYRKMQPGDNNNCIGGLRKIEPASFDSNSMNLTNLDTSATYHVCMRIKTRHGFSPYSDPVMVKMSSPDGSSVPVIIGVCVSLVVILLLFMVCMIRHRRKLFPLCTKMEIDLTILHAGDKKGNLFGISNATYTPTEEMLKVQPFGKTKSEGFCDSKSVYGQQCKLSIVSDINVLLSANSENMSTGRVVHGSEAVVTAGQPQYERQGSGNSSQCDSGVSSQTVSMDKLSEASLQLDLSASSYVVIGTDSKEPGSAVIIESSDKTGYATFNTHDSRQSSPLNINKEHPDTYPISVVRCGSSDLVANRQELIQKRQYVDTSDVNCNSFREIKVNTDTYQLHLLADGYARFSQQYVLEADLGHVHSKDEEMKKAELKQEEIKEPELKQEFKNDNTVNEDYVQLGAMV